MHIHTVEDLFTWLFSYTEYEKICMEYFQKHKMFMPHFLQEERLKELNLDIIDTIHPYEIPIPGYKEWDKKYSSTQNRQYQSQDFINGNDAFAILKHPRYHNCTIHSHNFFEFIYVFHGTCKNIIFSEENHELLLNKEDLLLIPPNTLHKIIVDDESIVLNILVRFDWMSEHIIMCLPMDHPVTSQITQIILQKSPLSAILFKSTGLAIVRNSLYEMVLEYCSNTKFKNEVTTLAFCKYLLLLFTYAETSTLHSDYGGTLAKMIPTVVSYISQNYPSLKCSEIADHFHFTQSHLNSTFQKIMGTSLNKYLMSVRLRESCKFLENTSWSIHDIAMRVGYVDAASFSRAFKAEKNITPQQYRKQFHHKHEKL